MILAAGGTGFIGSHLIRALHEAGRSVSVLARSPLRATLATKLGFKVVRGDIADPQSLSGKLDGVETVVHLVGLIEQSGDQTFERVVTGGTLNLAAEARRAGVKHIVYISSIGADINSPHLYHRTKAQAERAVRESGVSWTILRPSLVIGKNGGFVQKLMGLIKSPGPYIPVPGSGKTRFQPVYVGDLARCIIIAIDDPAAVGNVYEVGGATKLTYNDMLIQMAKVMGRKKRLLHMPLSMVMAGASVLAPLGMSPVTKEQLKMLSVDNVCTGGCVKESFGFEPLGYLEAVKRST